MGYYSRIFSRRYTYYYTSITDFRQNHANYSDKQVEELCRRQKLSKKFMREMKEYLDWKTISQYQPLTEELMEEFKYQIHWDVLCRWNKKIRFTESFMEKMIDYLDWTNMCRSRHLSKDFIHRHADILDVNALFNNYSLHDIHNAEVLDWFLKVDKNSFNWKNSIYDGLTIDFVREYLDVIKGHFSMLTSFFANHKQLEQYVDEFGKYFTDDEWGYVERNLYHVSFDFIIKYSDKWKYARYSCPISYNSSHMTSEQKQIIRYLWDLHRNDN